MRLRQTFGAHAGRVLELDGEVVRIGRAPDNDVTFDPHVDLDASAHHAVLRWEGGHWWVADAGSRNGTFVNGRRCGDEPVTVGDEIECGPGGPRLWVDACSAPGSAPVQTLAHVVPESPAPAPPPVAAAPRRAVRSMDPWKVAVGCLSVAVLVLLGAVGTLVWILYGQRANSPPSGPKAPLLVRAELERTYAGAVFAVTPKPGGRPICEAFAVRPRILATAASCVVELERSGRRRVRVAPASAEGGRAKARRVAALWRHPDERVDVGLLELDGPPVTPIPLASLPRLARLGVAEPLLVLELHEHGLTARPISTRGVRPLAPGATALMYGEPGPEQFRGAPLVDATGRAVGIHLGGGASHRTALGLRAEALEALLSGLGR